MNTATRTGTEITVTIDGVSASYASTRPTTHVAARLVDGTVYYTEHSSRALAAKATQTRGGVVVEVTETA